jgi:hypothetical protein
MATGGGWISPPGRWGGSRPPPVARSIFFFFVCRKSRRRWAANGGGWRRLSPEVGGGLFIWWLDLLIWCFDFIFSLYNFLKWVRCQLMNGGQKCGVFCHDRTATPPFPVSLHNPNQIQNDVIVANMGFLLVFVF